MPDPSTWSRGISPNRPRSLASLRRESPLRGFGQRGMLQTPSSMEDLQSLCVSVPVPRRSSWGTSPEPPSRTRSLSPGPSPNVRLDQLPRRNFDELLRSGSDPTLRRRNLKRHTSPEGSRPMRLADLKNQRQVLSAGGPWHGGLAISPAPSATGGAPQRGIEAGRRSAQIYPPAQQQQNGSWRTVDDSVPNLAPQVRTLVEGAPRAPVGRGQLQRAPQPPGNGSRPAATEVPGRVPTATPLPLAPIISGHKSP